ncbi:hypothetical protein FKM82_007434 [Ascaphus truei]
MEQNIPTYPNISQHKPTYHTISKHIPPYPTIHQNIQTYPTTSYHIPPLMSIRTHLQKGRFSPSNLSICCIISLQNDWTIVQGHYVCAYITCSTRLLAQGGEEGNFWNTLKAAITTAASFPVSVTQI